MKEDYINSITLEYIAGFLDGEGCIQVNTSQGGGRGFHLTVSLAQKDFTILYLIKEKFPEFNFKLESGSFKSGTSYLRVYGRSAIPFLKAMKNKSVIKRKQIILALELLSLTGNGDMTFDTWLKKDKLMKNIKFLKVQNLTI